MLTFAVRYIGRLTWFWVLQSLRHVFYVSVWLFLVESCFMVKASPHALGFLNLLSLSLGFQPVFLCHLFLCTYSRRFPSFSCQFLAVVAPSCFLVSLIPVDACVPARVITCLSVRLPVSLFQLINMYFISSALLCVSESGSTLPALLSLWLYGWIPPVFLLTATCSHLYSHCFHQSNRHKQPWLMGQNFPIRENELMCLWHNFFSFICSRTMLNRILIITE